jgi:P27 family predicted phage terminase small subunit
LNQDIEGNNQFMAKTKANSVAPKSLRKESAAFFDSVMKEYFLADHQVILLHKACESLDRIEEAREIIKRDGLTFKDRWNTPKASPAVAIERDNKISVARLFRELGLDLAGDGKTSPAALPANRG